MKSNLLLATLISLQFAPSSAQVRLAAQDYGDFFEWFHERSQVSQLYTDRSTLYTFTDQVNVRKQPSTRAAVVTQLPIGHALTNIAYKEQSAIPRDCIKGYDDIWYHVRGIDAQGRAFSGYVWGAHIAKGWREADLNGDGMAEFIMLGIPAQSRTHPHDINGEVRILQDNRLIGQALAPGLCVFEECASSPMLRVLQSQKIAGLTIVEAGTMTIGCMTGIDRIFYYWNGSTLERVYQMEYATNTELYRKSFVVSPAGSRQTTIQICEYGGEDGQYNPTWNCRTVPVKPATEAKPIAVGVMKIGGK